MPRLKTNTINPIPAKKRKRKIPNPPIKKRLVTVLTANWEVSNYSVDQIYKGLQDLMQDQVFWTEFQAYRQHEEILFKLRS